MLHLGSFAVKYANAVASSAEQSMISTGSTCAANRGMTVSVSTTGLGGIICGRAKFLFD